MLETINKNQVNVILNKNTDEIATLIEKHRNTMITSKKIIKLKKLFKYIIESYLKFSFKFKDFILNFRS